MDDNINVLEDQEVEIASLTSIYEDKFIISQVTDNGRKGEFKASPALPPSFHIYIKTTGDSTAEKSKENKKCKLYPVSHLPPITLDFILPKGYPCFQAPIYTLSCQWLPQQMLAKLSARLDQIWEENSGSVLLFNWFHFLEDESLEYMQIESPLELSAFVPFPDSSTVSWKNKNTSGVSRSGHFRDGEMKEKKMNTNSIKVNEENNPNQANVNSVLQNKNETSTKECLCSDPDQRSECSANKNDLQCQTVKEWKSTVRRMLYAILEFNRSKEQATFDYSLVHCEVCFTEQVGSKCMRFQDCHHAYCKECMQQYFTVQIRDGSVKALNCPTPDCDSQALPKQVEELVEKKLYERYEKLLLQVALDTMKDVVYCPRRTCQNPVIKDADNLAQCNTCHYNFCARCTHAYHNSSPCSFKSVELRKVYQDYRRGNKETKRFLEKRYGKQMICQILQEASSAEWLEQNAKMCPSCGTHIEKTDGCNKMTCSKCKAYFCWLCSTQLSRKDPYVHFNEKKSRCFQKLFDGVDPAVWDVWEEEEWEEEEWENERAEEEWAEEEFEQDDEGFFINFPEDENDWE